ncbi:phosphoglycerate kinase [Xanthobacter flavus]|uniref:Phosphoglycerate kinase n=1 Tax=Xanthobacter flavus TaxID=281 RepID=A0A9W6FMR1_XANFL|nr:phosphoglycerate kinase [Xanthobacter flavus]MDR6334770.1 phosphoglycerate kinase [Xanthobacter flavus]GLI23208.1 phosphoglycerate kinase [Xanthobacter flavus]
MIAFRTLDDAVDLADKRVLVRVDLNVPMESGRVTDATRLKAILPTIRDITGKGGKVVLLAHFGRPKGRDDSQSLAPVAKALEGELGRKVAFASDCIGDEAKSAVSRLASGEVIVLENTRFHAGEEKNAPDFIEALANLGDIYVNDAFSTAHRAHASTEGLARKLPAYAGRSMESEIEALTKALEAPQRPVLAVVGGSKVSTKLELLGNLVQKVDILVIGGGMANTFLAALGKKVGKSLCEHDLGDTARDILEKAKAAGCEIVLPVDAVVATEFKANAAHRVASVDDVKDDEMMLDAGPETVGIVKQKLDAAKTVVWNGPFGAFELTPFDAATVAVARYVGDLTHKGKLLSVAGGGDTVAALNHAGTAERFSYVSTAGGAFLEWLEGKALPGVEALRR